MEVGEYQNSQSVHRLCQYLDTCSRWSVLIPPANHRPPRRMAKEIRQDLLQSYTKIHASAENPRKGNVVNKVLPCDVARASWTASSLMVTSSVNFGPSIVKHWTAEWESQDASQKASQIAHMKLWVKPRVQLWGDLYRVPQSALDLHSSPGPRIAVITLADKVTVTAPDPRVWLPTHTHMVGRSVIRQINNFLIASDS